MSEQKEQQLQKLKEHFGRRVHDQARTVVRSWGQLQQAHWHAEWHQDFCQSDDKLVKLAERYGFDRLHLAARQLAQLLAQTKPEKAPKSELLEEMNRCIVEIADACSRANDDLPLKHIASARKPVYLCFADQENAQRLAEQLGHFGIPVQPFEETEAFEKAILYRLPAAVVVDTAFDGGGIELLAKVQSELRVPIPAVFFSQHEPSIEERLAVVRANGVSFYTGEVDFSSLVEQLIHIYSLRNEPPYRVLVVDDSKSQALYAEKTLNAAGLFTRAVLEPLQVLDVLDQFQPDAILMDMYMPDCMGPELAQVIRQQSKYDAIPILYLSAESDVGKQLEAVGQGGDDFLTKPVAQDVLIATVVNRCRRHRGLHDQMIRDSLTGLIDHNNTLEALATQIQQSHLPEDQLTFVMIDIDFFKKVNDQYGHGMGDRVIHALSLYLRQRFRVSDTIGRYGGEEFALVLPGCDEQTAVRLLDEVRAGFGELVHQQNGQELQVTFSCGVAQVLPGDSVTQVAQRADQALYQAKANGRNCVVGAQTI